VGAPAEGTQGWAIPNNSLDALGTLELDEAVAVAHRTERDGHAPLAARPVNPEIYLEVLHGILTLMAVLPILAGTPGRKEILEGFQKTRLGLSARRSLGFLTTAIRSSTTAGPGVTPHPPVQLIFERKHRTARTAAQPSNRQAQLSFPALHGSNATIQLGGDFFPGLQGGARWYDGFSGRQLCARGCF
jgi:hypothetical protein